jgi:AraC-like DNA-binding protein
VKFLLIVCTIAVSHAFFWASILPVLNKRLSNKLLSLLLVLLSFRVGKSVIGMLIPEQEFLFASIGVIAMSGIGPALYLFTRSFFDREVTMRPVDYLHFVPCLIPLVSSFNHEWPTMNYTYWVFTISVFIYIALSIFHMVSRRELLRPDDVRWRWMAYLLTGITIISITFVCQLLFYHPLVYRLIVISAAVVFYSISWWTIPRAKIFITDPRKKPSDIKAYDDLGKRILDLLEKEEIYIDSNLTVSKLAARLKVPAYVASRSINHNFEKSFSELMLAYRIKQAERLLLADVSLTVEAIAFESGFNTLSSFYSAFKKINGLTPAQFRDKKTHQNLKIAK